MIVYLSYGEALIKGFVLTQIYLESFLKMVRRVLSERSDTVRTIREKLVEEGREEGIEKGRQEYLLLLEKTLKMKLQTTYLPEEILSLMKEAKIEDLRRVSEFIFAITSFEDVRSLLLKKDLSG